MKKRKMAYAGHILKGSSGDTHLCVLEGKVARNAQLGRPRLIWMDDIVSWSKQMNYEHVKRMAED